MSRPDESCRTRGERLPLERRVLAWVCALCSARERPWKTSAGILVLSCGMLLGGSTLGVPLIFGLVFVLLWWDAPEFTTMQLGNEREQPTRPKQWHIVHGFAYWAVFLLGATAIGGFFFRPFIMGLAVTGATLSGVREIAGVVVGVLAFVWIVGAWYLGIRWFGMYRDSFNRSQ